MKLILVCLLSLPIITLAQKETKLEVSSPPPVTKPSYPSKIGSLELGIKEHGYRVYSTPVYRLSCGPQSHNLFYTEYSCEKWATLYINKGRYNCFCKKFSKLNYTLESNFTEQAAHACIDPIIRIIGSLLKNDQILEYFLKIPITKIEIDIKNNLNGGFGDDIDLEFGAKIYDDPILNFTAVLPQAQPEGSTKCLFKSESEITKELIKAIGVHQERLKNSDRHQEVLNDLEIIAEKLKLN